MGSPRHRDANEPSHEVEDYRDPCKFERLERLAKKKKPTSLIVFEPSRDKPTAETILSNVKNVANEESKASASKDYLEFSPEIREKKQKDRSISPIKTQEHQDDSIDLDDDFDGIIVQEKLSN